MSDRTQHWGFSLFGDDIRHEVGGKLSLMGVYQADYILVARENPPLMIPKLAVLIMYYEQLNASAGSITFKVTYEGENLMEAPLSALPEFKFDRQNALPLSPDEIDKEGGNAEERIFHCRIPIVIAPFTFPGRYGFLRVRAHYEDGSVLRLGSLRLNVRSPSENNELAPSGP